MGVRHFLSVTDFSTAELHEILRLAYAMKVDPAAYRSTLAGKTLGMIFQKRSTRTRVSFEVGMFQLGGHALFLSASDIQIGRGESISDTSQVLSRYVDGMMARLYGHDTIVDLATHATVPVINGLTDWLHPCQTLADAMTMTEHFSGVGFDPTILQGKRLCYVGDAANNMAHSLMLTGAMLGFDVTCVAPKGYWPAPEILTQSRALASATGATIDQTDDCDAVEGADVVYSDVWVSMGMDDEKERRLSDLAAYQVNAAMMAKTADDSVFMHCLPAHRGEEVSAEVCDGPKSIIFDEAENRLHAQKALMATLLR
jgi:ornithine carbamoyltransferase